MIELLIYLNTNRFSNIYSSSLDKNNNLEANFLNKKAIEIWEIFWLYYETMIKWEGSIQKGYKLVFLV